MQQSRLSLSYFNYLWDIFKEVLILYLFNIRGQIYYLIIASLIGYLGGGTNFLPQLFGLYPFGQFITFLYPVVFTYGMYLKKY